MEVLSCILFYFRGKFVGNKLGRASKFPRNVMKGAGVAGSISNLD